jgi:heptosyltransferase-3
MAGRISAGPVAGTNAASWLKRFALTHPAAPEDEQHRIEEILSVGTALGVAPVREVVCPAGAVRTELMPRGDYAVIHAGPMFRYKQWTQSGWRELAAALRARGLSVVATGGPSAEDRRYLDTIWDGADVRRLDGVLTWAELAALIRAARLYAGPDTSVTHLAAATGVPTIAVYGPTDPRRWGPWPAGGLSTAWAAAGTIQSRGNVWLVQNPLPCMPCQNEGCERRLDSHSQCLDELPVEQVLVAADRALQHAAALDRAPAMPQRGAL